MCFASATASCKWNISSMSCQPESGCRPSRCGVIQCICQSIPIEEQTPWEVLRLDPRLALSPPDVRSAYHELMHVLHPDKNPGCRELAGMTFVIAHHSHDILLKLATTFGDQEARVEASSMIDDRIGQPAPAIHSLLRIGHGWFMDVRRALTTNIRKLGNLITKHSFTRYLHYPALFLVASVVLQFAALSQL